MIARVLSAAALGAAVTTRLGAAAPPPPTPITIRFAAVVGEQPFACGREYPGIGTAGTTITPLDFRLYVSEVALIDRKGKAVPVRLAEDGVWQRQGVAMLDFEDGTGACSNGSAETRLAIEGTAPAGDYAGVRFTLGIPFALNHRNPVEQGSPFNVTSMFWVWRAGYKFLRLDVKATGPVERLFVHLGSTGCVAADSLPASPAVRCQNPNRSVVTIAGFDPARDTVIADVAALFQGSDLTANQPKTAMGCMSAPDDADCGPLFDRLGLAFGERTSGGQQFFRIGRGGAVGASGGGAR
ncbi:MAG: metallo-mystery pair system four-Cys motif protein [Gemmatimonadales bacterium]|nr:metallo-mystery pair system four-Cys motif protein [Gemmatimonadales bacterium]